MKAVKVQVDPTRAVNTNAQADQSSQLRQVVSGSDTNAGTGAEAPVVTTSASGVPADPATKSAAPPLQQATLATGSQPQVSDTQKLLNRIISTSCITFVLQALLPLRKLEKSALS